MNKPQQKAILKIASAIEDMTDTELAGLLIAGLADGLRNFADKHPDGIELRSVKLTFNDFFEEDVWKATN